MEQTVLYRIMNVKYDREGTVLRGPPGKDIAKLQEQFDTQYGVPKVATINQRPQQETNKLFVTAIEQMEADGLTSIGGAGLISYYFVDWLVNKQGFQRIEPTEHTYTH